MNRVYCRFPHISGEAIVFAAREQLWRVNRAGGKAQILASGTQNKSHPYFSADGKRIAYTEIVNGSSEVFLLDLERPEQSEQKTFLGEPLRTVAWSGEHILFASSARRPISTQYWLYGLKLNGEIEAKPYGPVVGISESPVHGRVLCRYEFMEASAWKRYRGGARGDLWIERGGSGEFTCLPLPANGNLSRPCWVGSRLFFISDHEGVGHVYSCDPHGGDLRRHTPDSDFYVRHLASDGKSLVFVRGGDLFCFDPKADAIDEIEVELPALEPNWRNRWDSVGSALLDFSVNADASRVAVIARGHLLAKQEATATFCQLSEPSAAPVRVPRWLNEREILTFRDRSDRRSDVGIVHHVDGGPERELDLGEIGRIVACEVRPGKDSGLALANHRNELYYRDQLVGSIRVDRCDFEIIDDATWSPDGKWLAFSRFISPEISVIKIWNAETAEIRTLTKPFLRDRNPTFDVTGKYLYFISERRLRPVVGQLGTAVHISASWQPCVFALETDTFEVLPLPQGEYQAIWGGRESAIYLDRRAAQGKLSVFRWDM